MPTLTLTLGRDYGRSTGELASTADFSEQLTVDGPDPEYDAVLTWEGPEPSGGGSRPALARHNGHPLEDLQGVSPVNGLALHMFNRGTAQQTFALIGVPLETWVGHRVRVHVSCNQGNNWYYHNDYHDLVFVTDTENYPLDHSPASIGAAHWHPSIDEWRRMKERLTALEVEQDLRKGAAAGSS